MSKTSLYPLSLHPGLIQIRTIHVFSIQAPSNAENWWQWFLWQRKYHPLRESLSPAGELSASIAECVLHLRRNGWQDSDIWRKKGGVLALGAFSLAGEMIGSCLVVDNELRALCVDDRYKGQGIGAELVRAAELAGAERLSCFEFLEPFYAGLGWRAERREENWTEGEPDVLHMRAPGHDV
ncbi:putative DNA primase [Pseudomonas phage LKD16]|uniref:Putative DNA primase n=1 Tax=Pseudomonas phage LKD16 TaxID=386792 RepID=Q0E652_9CAUD|nr:putative DNA primase [Pseudomonas phage LKD16]CAK25947.1 putative DNA primase [Pseudomonas phage LKD16]